MLPTSIVSHCFLLNATMSEFVEKINNYILKKK